MIGVLRGSTFSTVTSGGLTTGASGLLQPASTASAASASHWPHGRAITPVRRKAAGVRITWIIMSFLLSSRAPLSQRSASAEQRKYAIAVGQHAGHRTVLRVEHSANT